ncbi:hypothetical protein [Devosia sp. Root105]|uniref:hypothetical protein n=1 Tax=Devosia sp. Root105 TaxID=1736423 RepID=UPI0006F2C60E|nr:hypothetical protein [Devosia sp. Root105]KQU93865.1 hypothetical protein ASC68_19440 [Devosia sp. Root105]
MSNQITIDQMIAKLDELATARVKWQQGTLKASNDELHTLLSRCVLLYRELSPSLALKTKLTEALDLRGIKSNRNANLATRVVRWVFGADEPQEFVYAKVIRLAAGKMPEGQSMTEWLLRNGGLTQVASQDGSGSDKKQRRQDQIQLGRSHLDAAPALATLPSDLASLQPTSDTFSKFAIALVRRSEAGAYEVVYGDNNAALVDSMLLLAGKAVEQQSKAHNATNAAVSQAATVADVVDAISAELAA